MPDAVLMDIRMPGKDGVEGTRLIKNRYPNVKVIVLTTFDDDEYVYGALKYGASGYLLKGCSKAELMEAIHLALSGGAMINPEIATKVIRQFSEMARREDIIQVSDELADQLNESEIKIIRVVGRGLSNREISATLYLSEGTVRNYISSILTKLELRDRTQLAIWAVQKGMAD
jgi:DNA-binding NarL/FixJ family response regulator